MIAINSPVFASVTLPSIFSDHMVLQRDNPIRVWGKGTDGAKVTVSFRGESASTWVKNGNWLVILNSCKAGGPFELRVISDKDSITYSDVLVGDVWICGGQSNMEMPIDSVANSESELAKAANPNIRYFNQSFDGYYEPQNDVIDGRWAVDDPENSRRWFSAVGWFFAQKVLEYEDVPFALINAYKGASPAQLWLPLEDLEGDPSYARYLEDREQKIADYEERKEAYEKEKAAGVEIEHSYHQGWFASGPYNSMIHPLASYGIKGVIWYQGESNSVFDDAVLYEDLFTKLIESWRREFRDENLPFFFVQLSSFAGWTKDYKNQWPIVREAQGRIAQNLSNTGMAVSFDYGDIVDIHPRNKKPVGERLAFIALNKVYGKEIEYQGPLFSKLEVNEEGIAVVHFDNFGLGLETSDGQSPRGFYLAGEDHRFFAAEATIHEGTIALASNEVRNPKYVRYGWLNYLDANLYGKSGLPVPPFRSDDLPYRIDNYYPEDPMMKYLLKL